MGAVPVCEDQPSRSGLVQQPLCRDVHKGWYR